MHVVARAPNHLGDGVMALPAMHALASIGRLTIAAPRWGPDLYRDVPARIVGTGTLPYGDAAVLFPPSLRVAWEARRLPRRIGVASDHRRWLLTDVVEPGPHRRDTYAALAAALGARARGAPTYAWRPDDPETDVPDGHAALVPISASGAPVMWRGFRDLARRLDRAVFYGGPGEQDAVAAVAGPHLQRVGLTLPALARALSRARVLVGNDSGSAHFARACGVPTVVVYGSTAPERTGPAGATAVEGEAPCRPCYRKSCPYDLECLDVPVERVEAAIRAVAP